MNYCGSRLPPLFLDKVLDLTAGSQEGISAHAGLEEGKSVVNYVGNYTAMAVIMKNMAHNRGSQVNNRTDMTFKTEPRCDISAHQKGL